MTNTTLPLSIAPATTRSVVAFTSAAWHSLQEQLVDGARIHLHGESDPDFVVTSAHLTRDANPSWLGVILVTSQPPPSIPKKKRASTDDLYLTYYQGKGRGEAATFPVRDARGNPITINIVDQPPPSTTPLPDSSS